MVTFLLVLAVIALAWVTVGYTMLLFYMLGFMEDSYDMDLESTDKAKLVFGVMFGWPMVHMEVAKHIKKKHVDHIVEDFMEEEEV